MQTVKDADELTFEIEINWSSYLQQEECVGAVLLTGKMADGVRRARIKQWLDGKVPILVATSCFGTGIDVLDVRLIVHMGEQYSFSDFAQQVG